MTRSRQLLTGVLVSAMGVSTFQFFAIAILSSDLIDDLGITRTELGFVATANTITGALIAPKLGAVTDRIGARNSIVVLCLISAAGLFLTAVSPSLPILLIVSAFCGLPQGWGNPATNKLISEELAPDARGVIAGFKQSGVQFGNFLAGLTLPGIAAISNWRVATGLYGFIALAAAGAALWLPTGAPYASSSTEPVDPDKRRGYDPFVVRVAVYAGLFGLVGGGVFRFIPLFAEERLGFSSERAGLVVAVGGALGIIGRIWWGRLTETKINPQRGLFLIGIGSVISIAGLIAAEAVGSWVLWAFSIVSAFCLGAWNVVAMLGVIRSVPSDDAGRSTGIVMLGFLGGLAFGAPITGWLTDRSDGDYQAAWWLWLAVAVVGTLTMAARRSEAEAPSYTPST